MGEHRLDSAGSEKGQASDSYEQGNKQKKKQ
jgi:hypothetical protein